MLQKQKDYNKRKREQYELKEFENGKRQAELIQKELENERNNLSNEKVHFCNAPKPNKNFRYLTNILNETIFL